MGLATFMFTNLNLSVSFFFVSIPNILLGVGVILTFIPVSALVLGTLPKTELANGSSLHNLCKTVGAAFVVSMSSTIVARHSQIHQVYLVKNLSDFSTVFQQKVASLASIFVSDSSSMFAVNKAGSYLYKQMLVQAKLMSYVDVFATFALLSFILIPLPFLLSLESKKED